jgi:hypothetical protein
MKTSLHQTKFLFFLNAHFPEKEAVQSNEYFLVKCWRPRLVQPGQPETEQEWIRISD